MVPQRQTSVHTKRNPIIKTQRTKKKSSGSVGALERTGVQWQTPAFQTRWFSGLLDSALGSSLSHLEHAPPLSEESFISLQQEGGDRDSSNLSKHVKSMFGEAWTDSLCKGEGDKEKGSPTLLILCSSATRCVELLKGIRGLTKACKPAKLFAKHIKVEEQVKALEEYVNIAVGTPNRVKKLIDIGALGLGFLEIVLLDMHEDAKGFTIFTMPQIKTDLLELCRAHFQQCALEGKLKFCLY
eukprot:c984_g1_i1 orf=78-800(+)